MNETADYEKRIIGIMDPNGYSLRVSVEGLLDYLKPVIKYKGKNIKISHRRIVSRPYNVLGAKTSCSAIMNRGAHWNPHHNSFFTMVMPKTYLLNDMVAFKSIDKNTSYGQMHELGLHIPKTWAIPQEDYSDLMDSSKIEADLIFPEHELFDLREIGDNVGYPAFLKPQSGGGWVGVEKVNNYEELYKAYKKSGDKPVNLQEAIDYREFVRTVGVGPQMIPMHYNAASKYSHDRYLRNEHTAVDFNFITPEEYDEVCKITKVINAFYNWDHNSCESLISKETGNIHPIDFANAYPDSNLVSLHFYFPTLVKSMVKWLIYNAVTERTKPVFGRDWDDYYAILKQSNEENWSYKDKLNAYAALADKHFTTKEFNEFEAECLSDFEEKAYEYFSSEHFSEVIDGSVRRYFKIAQEVPKKLIHYGGIHKFWLHCEAQRLGL
ncbi:MAG: hypothetical protein U0457_08685 [Candidatus Sericytochromatia bacterium]